MVATPVADSVRVSPVGNVRVVIVGVPVHIRDAWEIGYHRACGRAERTPDPDIAEPMVVPRDEVSRDKYDWNGEDVADHVRAILVKDEVAS